MITLSYLWLPYMIIPVYAGFERVPRLAVRGERRPRRRHRSHHPFGADPAHLPGDRGRLDLHVLADASATTSRCSIVGGKTQLLANVIYGQLVTANNQPLAAALSVIPLVAIVLYLLAMRRTGALENV